MQMNIFQKKLEINFAIRWLFDKGICHLSNTLALVVRGDPGSKHKLSSDNYPLEIVTHKIEFRNLKSANSSRQLLWLPTPTPAMTRRIKYLNWILYSSRPECFKAFGSPMNVQRFSSIISSKTQNWWLIKLDSLLSRMLALANMPLRKFWKLLWSTKIEHVNCWYIIKQCNTELMYCEKMFLLSFEKFDIRTHHEQKLLRKQTHDADGYVETR